MSLTAAEQQERAREAAQLLANPLLREAFQRIENTYIDAFRNSAPFNSSDRETAYFRLTGLQEFRADLEAVVNNGKVAAMNRRLR